MATTARVLVVDDEEMLRISVGKILTLHGFEVHLAAGAAEALQCIAESQFDVLLTDLRMPGPGDGLTVIEAMRAANTSSINFLMSAYPDVTAASRGTTLQSDEILAKPLNIPAMIRVIKDRLAGRNQTARVIESVADILERVIPETVESWLQRVQKEPRLGPSALTRESRVAFVPLILAEIVARLRAGSTPDARPAPTAAREQGQMRRQQRFTASMISQEFRLLQASVFETLQNHSESLDFRLLINGVMTIADEMNAQLGDAMESFCQELTQERRPVMSSSGSNLAR